VRPAGSGTTRNTFQEGEINEYKSETLNARREYNRAIREQRSGL
jgi:hypothetical protein